MFYKWILSYFEQDQECFSCITMCFYKYTRTSHVLTKKLKCYYLTRFKKLEYILNMTYLNITMMHEIIDFLWYRRILRYGKKMWNYSSTFVLNTEYNTHCSWFMISWVFLCFRKKKKKNIYKMSYDLLIFHKKYFWRKFNLNNLTKYTRICSKETRNTPKTREEQNTITNQARDKFVCFAHSFVSDYAKRKCKCLLLYTVSYPCPDHWSRCIF